ncbi:MAG: S9 family peptidase [Asgard group archaeon]|nr:S9 family peptidase [Asgard group archaeon]
MYPKSDRIEIVDEVHGEKIVDPYRWLEEFENPEVQKWLEKQHEYTDSLLNQIPNYEKSTERVKELLSIGSITAPKVKNSYLFYSKQTTENQPILYVRKGFDGELKVLINPNEISIENPVALDWYHISPSAKYIAYGLSKDGDEWSLLHIKEVETGKILEDKIPRTRFCSLTWLPDETGFYYTRYPMPGSVPDGQENYNKHIFLHKIGTKWEDDPKIFGEGRSPQNHYYVDLSEDGRYLLVSVMKYTKNDLYILDTEANNLLEVIVGDDSLTTGSLCKDELWIKTNRNAPKGSIFKVKITHPSLENWQEIIPEQDFVISQALITEDNIYLRVMKKASDYIEVYDKEGKHQKEFGLPKYCSIYSVGSNNTISANHKINEFYFHLTSFFYPTRIYRYQIGEDKLTLFEEIKSPINADDFEVKQVWFDSKDGTKVPMFLAHKKDMKLDGNNPTMLCGYGGFNAALKPPYLKNSRFFWLERGGVIAIANLRGGSELGEDWHQDGMLERKQNVFDDFIYAGKWLIANGYASNNTLGIYGRSNGGLLTGAALTQEPDLFAAVYVGVPLLDMIRYHLFKIARYWIPEYGSSEDPDQFKFIHKYSPYHNVKKGTKYPATFLVTAASDSRVDANHAMKMTALLQWANASIEPIALFVERQAGHGIGKPLNKLAKTETDIFAFIGWKTGLKM